MLNGRLSDPPYGIRDTEVDGLIQALNKLFNSATSITVKGEIVTGLELLISNHGAVRVDNVASNLVEYIKQHELTPEELDYVVSLIFRINVLDSTNAFLTF